MKIAPMEALRIRSAAARGGHCRHGGPGLPAQPGHRAGDGGGFAPASCRGWLSRTLVAARALRSGIEARAARCWYLGKQAIDDDNGQPGPVAGGWWKPPHRTLRFDARVRAGYTARVTREGGKRARDPRGGPAGGHYPPTCGLNEPRYVKLPDIMKAQKNPRTLTERPGVEQRSS